MNLRRLQAKHNVIMMHQPAPTKPYFDSHITINRQRLKSTDKFTYLYSTLSRVIFIYDEMSSSLTKASVDFGRLDKNNRDRR